MNRRAFLAATAATTTIAGAKTAAADRLPLGPLPEMRYPDARIESADKKFFGTKFPAFAGTAGVERVATGFRWAEGPAFSREGNYLIFSDIPNNRMMRLLWDDNHLSVFIWAMFSYRLTEYFDMKAISTGMSIFPQTLEFWRISMSLGSKR
jgi:gluconolactonase